jgi:hypothetical protein
MKEKYSIITASKRYNDTGMQNFSFVCVAIDWPNLGNIPVPKAAGQNMGKGEHNTGTGFVFQNRKTKKTR